LARVAALAALLASAESLWASHRGTHCYEGHGGTPLDANDTAIFNVTTQDCEAACGSATNCAVITVKGGGRRRKPSGPTECYLRSDVNLSQCEVSESKYDNTWTTYTQVDPPPLMGLITYHLFEAKYTGVANRDAGDFKGDADFIFSTFSSWSKGNPEASMEHNIIEMSEINVTGWGVYEECNAPGAEGMFTCPENQTEYCCTHHDPKNHSHNIPAIHTSTQLPGLEMAPSMSSLKGGSGGFWFSFPKESQGVTWTEKTLRRIAGKCVGDAWRKDAGGCDECGEALDQCVATCIQASLCKDDDITLLQATWDRVFADVTECPEVSPPGVSSIMV